VPRAARAGLSPDRPVCAPAVVRWNGSVDDELRRELLARAEEDQRVRNQAPMPKGQYVMRLSPEAAEEWRRVDTGNTRWLAGVLATRGWPGRTMAGEDGAAAAWLLAQHADRDTEQQRAFLEALRGAVAEGEASPAHLAYLEDRVRVADGRPQLYGTQFTVADGEFGPFPIEDPDRLDERRAAAGLDTFAAYAALLRAGDQAGEE
jgi:hypothetical protein